ncbi:MAG: IS30 family transposase [Lawsonibacter sp.]
MDCQDYIIEEPERKRGQHLQREERGTIQRLRRLGWSLRQITEEVNCSASTVLYELRRGTPPRTGSRGRALGYSAKRGQAVYEANRGRCHKPHKVNSCTTFIGWVVQQVREHRRSLDACVGYARLHRLFKENEMVSTKTLYNSLWAGRLPLSLFEVQDVLKRRHTKGKNRIHKRPKGRSIEERPAIVDTRTEPGHWEADTVVGLCSGKEAVIFTLVERATDNYIAMQIPAKTSEAVQAVMQTLHTEFAGHFSNVFKSITADNGSEFDDFALVEEWGTEIYFAHPYSSWERPINERHNGLLREFIPKGVSIEKFSHTQILTFADEINGRPRRRLGYQTPEELFDAFLDGIYAA